MSDVDSACHRAMQELVRLGTPIVSDALLGLGRINHIAENGIRPVGAGHACAGVVRTAQFGPARGDGRDFAPLARFVDSTLEGEVLVLAGFPDTVGALWGDICGAAAELRGAAGVVLDGYTRDFGELGRASLPVFARGAFSRDSLVSSNIVDVNCQVTVGGVLINPGDVVVADADGVVFFEPALTDSILRSGEVALGREDKLRDLLRSDVSLYEAMTRVGTM